MGSKATRDLVVSGREKKSWERANMELISRGVMAWLVRMKKPEVEAADKRAVVMAWRRVEGEWREILGMLREMYFGDEEDIVGRKLGTGKVVV